MNPSERAKQLLNLDGRFDKLDEDKNLIVQYRDIDGCIHPSGLGGCTRKIWYALLMEEPVHSVAVKLRRTFEHGTAVHEWIQSKLEKIFEDSPHIRIEIEKKIGDTEIALKYRIAGSVDAFITVIDPTTGEELRIVYEIKTINNDGWDKLKEPQAKHIQQTNVYAKCLNASVIIFDYYNKDSDLHKRFYIEPKDTIWATIVMAIDNIFDLMRKGKEPSRNGTSWECRSCSYYHTCRPELHRGK